MERKLTIRETLCVRWLFCLITMLLVSVGMQAEDYGLTVAGVQVTDENASNITGTNITAGTVSFNNSTNTLTLNNATIGGTISSSIADLKVNLVGVSVFNIAMSSSYTYVFNYTGNDASPSVTFSADNLGATLLAYGDQDNNRLQLVDSYTVNYNPGVSSWINIYRRDTGTGDKPFIRLSKPYPIQIAGEKIDDSNKSNILRDDLSEEGSVARVRFNATTNTLTLNDAIINVNDENAIESGLENLIVSLEGSSVITCQGNDDKALVGTTDGARVSFNAGNSGTGFLQIQVSSESNLFSDITADYATGIYLTNEGYTYTIGPKSYGLTVGGVMVVESNAADVFGDGKVSYNNQTLSLNDATIEGDIISNVSTLTIDLTGTNSIRSISASGNANSLAFTGNGTLSLENSYGVISDFSSVDFGDFNLLSHSTPDIHWDTESHSLRSCDDDVAAQLMLTKATVYPIWVYDAGSEYQYRQITAANKTNVLGDDYSSVSYNGSGTLTLKGAQIAHMSYPSFTIGGSVETLTVHLLGYSIIGGSEQYAFKFVGENTSLTFTTSEKLPGVLETYGTLADGQKGDIVYQNSLGYTVDDYNKKVSVPAGDFADATYITGPTSVINDQDGAVYLMTNNGTSYYASNAQLANTDNHSPIYIKVVSANATTAEAGLWPSNYDFTSLVNKVIFQFDWGTCNNKNGTVQVRGISREENANTTTWPADGKTYSEAVSLATANTDGIIEIPLTSAVTSENIQLYISSSSEFSIVPLAVSLRKPRSYDILVAGVAVTDDNASKIEGEGITGTISYDDANNILTLDGATITPQEEGVGIYYSGTADLTIKLIGTNTINSGSCSAIRGGQTPKLIFTKAGEQPASLLMETTESSVIDGFSQVNHNGLFKIDERILGVDNTPDTYTVLVSSTLLSGGSGTAEDPLLIKTKEDLTNFAYYICSDKISRSVSVKLYNDLDCAGLTHFAPIGYNDLAFEGTFYGNDKTISNLSIENAGLATVGLFSYLSEGASVERLTLENCTINGGVFSNNNIGGLVGTLYGGTISNCIIKNSTISCKNDTQSPTVGGLVGELNSGSITNCTVQACTINAVTQDTGNSGPVAQAGGIVGNASGGTITGCQVKGATTVLADYGEREASVVAGTIVGRKGSATLSNNTYEYAVTASTNKYNGTTTVLTTKSGYQQRGVGGQTYNEQTEQYEDNPDIFEDNGAVMYTQTVTLPAETPQATATVTGEENTYYSTTVISDALAYTVAPGQTVTLNANPANGYAIGSLTAKNTTTSAAITTTPTDLGDGIMQYTFTMPDAPVTVTVTTVAAYGISVAGVAVTELNYTDVLGDGKVSFALPVQSLETPAESKPATLTLNGATINGSIVSSLTGELAVHLLGSNVIDGGWSEDANGQYAFVSESESASLAFTTDDENPGQLLMKNTYRNNGYGQYYLNGFRWNKTFGNGLVEGYSNDQYSLKCMIAVAPVVTPGEGLYWTDQQYTIPEGTQITCSDSQGHAVNVNVTENSFTLTTTGKYTISISKAVTVDESNFSLSNSGLYIVHNKPGFSKEAGSYTGSQTITLTNLPEDLPVGAEDYPQVWYYLGEDDDKAVRVYSAEQEIAVSESTKVCVYFLDEDSGKVLKSANVEAEYTIRQDPALRFYTSENSYMSTGSTENISYGEEFTSPVLKGKIGNAYTNELTVLGITYSSSDETVATIDQTGKITIVGGGFVTITATSQQTDLYAASSTNFILKIRPADPNVSLEEGAYYTGQSLTMLRVGENGTMYYSYGDKNESQRTVYPEGGISLPKGCYDFYPYTRCGTDEQNIWSYGNAHRMMYVYDQPTISKNAGTYDDKIEVEITNLPESGYYSASVYYYFDDDEEHAVQYTSGSKITINESKTLNVYIYVEGDSGKTHKTEIIERQYVIRQDAGLAYTQNNESVEVAEYTIGGSNNTALPTLQNENKLTVTYTSSKETVATVNGEGVVTPVGVGETTITAASAQTETLQAGEASYTLKVYKDLNHESITVSVANATYTGSEVEPDVTVKDGTTDVTAYFTFSYSDNVQVGTNAKVTIVPNNNLEVNFYVGSRTETFAIDNRTLEIGKDVNFASGQKWASFYTTTENLELPDGVMAYIVTGVANSAVSVKAINYVPKNVPVLIENESTTTTDNASAEGNLLQGTTESTAVSGIEGNVYVLYNGGFTRATSGAIPARRAYLVLEQNAGARLSIFEDDATGIGSVANSQQLKGNEQYYDLQGRKVESHAKKGLYIKNGRKVVVK